MSSRSLSLTLHAHHHFSHAFRTPTFARRPEYTISVLRACTQSSTAVDRLIRCIHQETCCCGSKQWPLLIIQLNRHFYDHVSATNAQRRHADNSVLGRVDGDLSLADIQTTQSNFEMIVRLWGSDLLHAMTQPWHDCGSSYFGVAGSKLHLVHVSRLHLLDMTQWKSFMSRLSFISVQKDNAYLLMTFFHFDGFLSPITESHPKAWWAKIPKLIRTCSSRTRPRSQIEFLSAVGRISAQKCDTKFIDFCRHGNNHHSNILSKHVNLMTTPHIG